MIKLLWVVYRPELQALDATVMDSTGKRRRVNVKWMAKDAMPVQKGWFDSVVAEIENQDSESNSGRLPF